MLTAALRSRGANVTALEIDSRLIALLRERDDLQGVTIVEGDALAFDYTTFARGENWRFVGNLPYNVGTPLVAEVVRRQNPPQRMVVMLQKDVVERLVAKPSTPAYGSLTLVVAARMHVRRAFTIGRSHFYPQPNVESSVAVLEPARPPIAIENLRRFDEVVRAAFAYRRKTLVNSLMRSGTASREQSLAALDALSIDPETRAEQLDLPAFIKLAVRLE